MQRTMKRFIKEVAICVVIVLCQMLDTFIFLKHVLPLVIMIFSFYTHGSLIQKLRTYICSSFLSKKNLKKHNLKYFYFVLFAYDLDVILLDFLFRPYEKIFKW